MKKNVFAVTVLYHALLLILVYLFQGMILPYLRLYGLTPMLLPIVGTGVAVYEGRDAGGVVGIFTGILCDVSLNAPVGLFTVLLTFTGLIVGNLADTVLVRRFATFLICCVVVLAISAFAQMFALLFFENVPPQALISIAIRQTLYSLLFAFPLWFAVRALGVRAKRVLPSGKYI